LYRDSVSKGIGVRTEGVALYPVRATELGEAASLNREDGKNAKN